MSGLASGGGLVLLAIMLAGVPVTGNLILGPVSRAAGRLQAPTRFQLSDFLWLLIQLQATLAITVQLIGIEMRNLFIPALAFLVFATAALWVGAISYLSRAAISHPWRRAAFTLLVLPGTLSLMIAVPLLVSAGLISVSNYVYRVAVGFDGFNVQYLLLGIAIGVSGGLAVFALGWLLRRMSLWVAAGSEEPVDAETLTE